MGISILAWFACQVFRVLSLSLLQDQIHMLYSNRFSLRFYMRIQEPEYRRKTILWLFWLLTPGSCILMFRCARPGHGSYSGSTLARRPFFSACMCFCSSIFSLARLERRCLRRLSLAMRAFSAATAPVFSSSIRSRRMRRARKRFSACDLSC